MKKYIVIKPFVAQGIGQGRLMLPNDIVYTSEGLTASFEVLHLWDSKTRVYLGYTSKIRAFEDMEEDERRRDNEYNTPL